MVDLRPRYEERRRKLLTWRERYTNAEYPFKVVLNIFYDLYIIKDLWDIEIDKSFQELFDSETDYAISYNSIIDSSILLRPKYSEGNTLTELMNTNQIVGNTCFQNWIMLIENGIKGDSKAIEEIEFSFIFKSLQSEAIIRWASFGKVGYNKQEAMLQTFGCVVSEDAFSTFENVSKILPAIMSKEINTLYKPLPTPFA